MHRREKKSTLIPIRRSLIGQATDILRAELQNGKWPNYLPPERSLCEVLHISRPTLRAALDILEGEKLIQKCHGQRTRVMTSSRKPKKSRTMQTIGFLSAESLPEMRQSHLLLVDELRRHLYAEGYQLAMQCDPRLRWGRSQQFVKQICERNPAACWVLLSQRMEVQQWFQEQGLRTVVLGSCYQGVHSPSIDSDYQASCHHAAGALLGLGHRRLLFMMPKARFAGDIAGENGFRRAAEKAPHKDVTLSVIRHDSTVESIQKALNSLLDSKNLPTGMLISHPQDLLTTITHFAKFGIRTPEDISLICMDDDEILKHVVPSIARYVINYSDYAKRLSHLVFQSVAKELRPRHVLITSKFQKGSSLASVGSNSL